MDELTKKAPKGAIPFGSLACGTFWKNFLITPPTRLGIDPEPFDTRKDHDDAKVSKSENRVNRKIA